MKKDVFCLVTSMGQNKKFWVPMRNWTSDLWIPHCDALPLSRNRSQSNLKTFRIWKSKVWLLWYNHGYLMVIWCMLWCSTTELELEHRIWRSEVYFLMGTQNFFFVQGSWQDEKTSLSISSRSSKLTISLILFTSWMILAFWLVLTYDLLETDA